MRRANRPYSVIVLEQNLLGVLPKKMLEASLQALSAEGGACARERAHKRARARMQTPARRRIPDCRC